MHVMRREARSAISGKTAPARYKASIFAEGACHGQGGDAATAILIAAPFDFRARIMW